MLCGSVNFSITKLFFNPYYHIIKLSWQSERSCFKSLYGRLNIWNSHRGRGNREIGHLLSYFQTFSVSVKAHDFESHFGDSNMEDHSKCVQSALHTSSLTPQKHKSQGQQWSSYISFYMKNTATVGYNLLFWPYCYLLLDFVFFRVGKESCSHLICKLCGSTLSTSGAHLSCLYSIYNSYKSSLFSA